MNRIDFSRRLTVLLNEMMSDGIQYILDYLLRSEQEQKRLFDAGLSKCDGKNKVSRHQTGKAIDIYFVINGNIDFDFKTEQAQVYTKKYHDFWAKLGGNPMIDWDKCHYEVS